MKVLVLAVVLLAIQGCSSLRPKSYKEYVAAPADAPKASIKFVPGPIYGPLVNLFFFEDAKTCTNRYVLALVSPKFDFERIEFPKNKPFAFTYQFHQSTLMGPVIVTNSCKGTHQFTPVADRYEIVLGRDGAVCYVEVTEVEQGRRSQRTPLIRRESAVPFTEEGGWCTSQD